MTTPVESAMRALAYCRAMFRGRTRWDGQELRHDEVLVAEVDRLRVALEPFADVFGEGTDDYPDEARISIFCGRSENYAVKLGDFRRARTVFDGGEG